MSKKLIFQIVFPVIVMMLIMMIGTVIAVPSMVHNNVKSSVLEASLTTLSQFKALRGYYTEYVVKKVTSGSTLVPSFDHRGDAGKIPLPATMIHDLSQIMEQEEGVSLKLYSTYPFPNRQNRRLDPFQSTAWETLGDRPNEVVSDISQTNDRSVMRVSIADVMQVQTCVDCHNSHPLSPKTDWQLGDVRGVLEVQTDITKQLALANTLSNAIVSGIVGAGIALICVFVLLTRRVTGPIGDMTTAMSRLSEGDYDVDVGDESHVEEIAQMATTVHSFREALIGRRKVEERFRDFADSSSDWFWEMDENLTFTYFSDLYEGISGFKPEDRVGTLRMEFISEEELSANPEKWAAHQADLEARRPFKYFEYTSTAVSSGSRQVSISGKPVFDTHGEFVGYRGTGTDITERKRLEEQLRHSQRIQAVGQLTGGVAHDFNNLLSVMIGNTEMLGDCISNNKEAKHHIDRLIHAIDSAEYLTSRLLSFSRQQNLSPKSTDITDLVSSIVDMLRRTLGEAVDLRVISGFDLWPATVDQHQLENALVNLAINARDAMPQGGSLTIETNNVALGEAYVGQYEDVTPGDYVRVVVSDTGTGIASEIIGKVFEPYFTTKGVGEGSGLGLSMVYGFAKQSGGHITIDSEINDGTTVTLYIPRSRDS